MADIDKLENLLEDFNIDCERNKYSIEIGSGVNGVGYFFGEPVIFTFNSQGDFMEVVHYQ